MRDNWNIIRKFLVQIGRMGDMRNNFLFFKKLWYSYKNIIKTSFFLMSRGCWRARRGNDGPGPRRCPALQAAAKVSGPLVGHRPPSSHQAELTSTLTLNCNVFSKRSSIYILYCIGIKFNSTNWKGESLFLVSFVFVYSEFIYVRVG